ncbi:MAG: D-Ala-D-Ala carboxypeptidase family metallohydrolase [Bacteroidales bacterium]|nr:D-Ala-D-Ala carboxypeptidase family metallohydrolase [Bacteroidales bacterium]
MTKNFTIEEFLHSATAYKLHISNNPDLEQMASLQELAIHLLQPLRDRYGKPITITSGFRSVALNAALGGAPNSQHTKGQAADIIADGGRDNALLFKLIAEHLSFDQLIFEERLRNIPTPDGQHTLARTTWVHVSYIHRGYNRHQMLLTSNASGILRTQGIASNWREVV